MEPFALSILRQNTGSFLSIDHDPAIEPYSNRPILDFSENPSLQRFIGCAVINEVVLGTELDTGCPPLRWKDWIASRAEQTKEML